MPLLHDIRHQDCLGSGKGLEAISLLALRLSVLGTCPWGHTQVPGALQKTGK